MADNILKGIIVLEAKGVSQSTTQVVNAVSRTETSLKKLAPASNTATQSLINLGRVAQDAPYGFIGIANNINPLLESFQRLRAESGSTGVALKSLGASLLGGGGLGFAISIVTSLLVVFSGSSKKAAEDTDKLNEKAQEAKDRQDEFKNALDAATSAVISQSKDLGNLRSILTSVNTGYQDLSKNIVDQAVAQFLFDKKNVEVQKLLSAELQKRLKLAEMMSPMLTLPSFTVEGDSKDPLVREAARAKDALRVLNETAKAAGVTFQNILKPVKEAIVDTYEDPFKDGKLDFNFREPIRLAELAAKELRESVRKELEQPIKPKVNLKFDESVKEALANLKGKLNISKDLGAIFGVGEKFPFLDDATANLVTMAQTLQGVLVPAFEGLINAIGSGKDAFRSFFQAIGQGIKQIFAQLAGKAALAGILSLVFPTGLGGAKGFGAIFQNLLGFRAGGGPVSSGGSYIVGERGPELFTPGMNGSIIPNGRMGSYGGGSLAGQVQFVISGNNLIGVMSAAGRNQRRLV